MKGFKECVIEPRNPLVFSEHDFAAAKLLTLMLLAMQLRLIVLILRPWTKSIKSRSNSPITSTSKDGVIRDPACEEEYCDPPTEEWIPVL
ncbi:hypothetical protein TNCV_1943701 [Trichonephila clavipes]|nr:hypothetical protein TNCV_1943701 [Trichonephila clavipes]